MSRRQDLARLARMIGRIEAAVFPPNMASLSGDSTTWAEVVDYVDAEHVHHLAGEGWYILVGETGREAEVADLARMPGTVCPLRQVAAWLAALAAARGWTHVTCDARASTSYRVIGILAKRLGWSVQEVGRDDSSGEEYISLVLHPPATA